MKIIIELNLPDLEEQPEKLPQTLRQLVEVLESDNEPEVNVMDGSMNVKDGEGNTVGTLNFEWEKYNGRN